MTRAFGVPRTPAWVVLVLCGTARADVLLTADGRARVGTVRIDGSQLRVDGGPAVAVTDVVDVTFGRAGRAADGACVLTDGTTLAGRVEAIDDDHGVRVATVAGRVTVPMGRVARVTFAAGTGGGKAADGGATGLLLRDGDFFDGSLKAYDGRTVTMSSPLLGEQAFDAGDRAACLVLRPVVPAAAAWVVRLTDGSTLSATAVSVVAGAVRAEVPGVGPLAVPLAAVAEVRAGGGRIVSLAEVPPAAGAVTVDGTGVGLPARLVGGGTVGRSVAVAAGSSVTYRLGGAYTAFAARVGVPANAVPMVGVRWSVAVDGKPVAGGQGRTAVDDPAVVSCPLAGANELTVTVAAGGVPLLLADPVLVRPAARPSGKTER